jgi:hypothetical protein
MVRASPSPACCRTIRLVPRTNFPGWGRFPSSARCSGARPVRQTRTSLSSYLIKPVPPSKKLKTPLDSSLAGNDLNYFLNGQPEVPKTPPFTFNPFGGCKACLAVSSQALPSPLPCLLRWPLLFPCLFQLWPLPRPSLFPSPRPYPLPFHKEMALSIMTQQRAISSIRQYTEVGSEFTERKDGIALSAGDAVASNAAVQIPTPWPRDSNDTTIAMDGERIARAVARYREGEKQPVATVPDTPLYGSTLGSANASSQESGAAAGPPPGQGYGAAPRQGRKGIVAERTPRAGSPKHRKAG